MIKNNLTFESVSLIKIKLNCINTMFSIHSIFIDNIEPLKLLKNYILVRKFDISVKKPETVSRFLSNFSFKTTQMLIKINFKVFKNLLCKSELTSITIDIDSSVINVKSHQENLLKVTMKKT